MIRIGVASRERAYFWKLLWWTFRHRPTYFEFVFLFSVLTFQFRKMYERYLASTGRRTPPARVEKRARRTVVREQTAEVA